jgi:hypothetical protein
MWSTAAEQAQLPYLKPKILHRHARKCIQPCISRYLHYPRICSSVGGCEAVWRGAIPSVNGRGAGRENLRPPSSRGRAGMVQPNGGVGRSETIG